MESSTENKIGDEKKKKRKQGKSENTDSDKTKKDNEESEKSSSFEEEEERTIFVGNLPLDINRKRLESIFKHCGKIKSSRLRSYGTTGVKVAPEHAGNQVWIVTTN